MISVAFAEVVGWCIVNFWGRRRRCRRCYTILMLLVVFATLRRPDVLPTMLFLHVLLAIGSRVGSHKSRIDTSTSIL